MCVCVCVWVCVCVCRSHLAEVSRKTRQAAVVEEEKVGRPVAVPQRANWGQCPNQHILEFLRGIRGSHPPGQELSGHLSRGCDEMFALRPLPPSGRRFRVFSSRVGNLYSCWWFLLGLGV